MLTDDRRLVRRTVPLPDGAGLIDFEFPVTGPAGFLAAKTAALAERSKDKDAYDLVWLLDAWPEGPAALAAEIAAGTARSHPEAITALHDQLGRAFADEDHHGPLAYARFVGTDRAGLDERAELALHAHGAVQAYLGGART